MTVQGQTKARPGQRMADLLSFLKKEIVDDEILFTANLARRVVEELGFRRTIDVWMVLQRLEKKSLILRKKKRYGKGILISFNTNKTGEPQAPKAGKSAKQSRKSKDSNTLTVPQLLGQLETEIDSLQKQLVEKQALYKQISTLARR